MRKSYAERYGKSVLQTIGSKKLKNQIDHAVKKGDPKECIELATKENILNVDRLQDVVLKNGTVKMCLYFVKNVYLSSVDLTVYELIKRKSPLALANIAIDFIHAIREDTMIELEETVIACNHPASSYELARYLPFSKMLIHQDIVLKSDDPFLCASFANNVNGADRDRLRDVVIHSRNAFCCTDIASKDDTEEVKQTLIDIVLKYGDQTNCSEIAIKTQTDNIEALQDVVVNGDFTHGMQRFMLYAKGADLKRFEKAFIGLGDAYYCYMTAKLNKNSDVIALGEVVIREGNKELCRQFMQEIDGADVEALKKAIDKKHW